jgi:hypothetical protein
VSREAGKPIFIGGCPRSGTSILAFLIGQHPNVLAYMEPGPFYELFNTLVLKRRFPLSLFRVVYSAHMPAKVVDSVSKQPAANGRDASSHFAASRIWQELRHLRSPGHCSLRAEFAEFAQRLLGGFALSCGRQRWAVKRPTYLYSHIDEIHAIHPDMKFIHVVRDGRDVIASIMRQPWVHRTPTRFDYAFRVWSSELNRGDAAAMQVPVRNLFRIRLEDLVSSEDHVRDLCEFMEEEYHPDMQSYFHRRVGSGSVHSGRWRKELTAHQIRKVEASGGDILARHGYI